MSVCMRVGCKNLGESRGKSGGRARFCSKHNKRIERKNKWGRCEICNWEGPCDIHRKRHGMNGGKYTKWNIMSLCPNCHRLHHAGRLIIVGGDNNNMEEFKNEKQIELDLM